MYIIEDSVQSRYLLFGANVKLAAITTANHLTTIFELGKCTICLISLWYVNKIEGMANLYAF